MRQEGRRGRWKKSEIEDGNGHCLTLVLQINVAESISHRPDLFVGVFEYEVKLF